MATNNANPNAYVNPRDWIDVITNRELSYDSTDVRRIWQKHFYTLLLENTFCSLYLGDVDFALEILKCLITNA